MITDISKGKFVNGLVDYHEKKVSEGKAKLIGNSTFGRTGNEYKKTFHDCLELNTRMQNNKMVHFSTSLHKDDDLDDSIFSEMAVKYLEKMGYENHPHLIYRHFDTDKQHIHIVTTGVDWEGKRVDYENDWERSGIINREFEKNYGLKLMEDVQKENGVTSSKEYKLSEINAERFQVGAAVNKALNNVSQQAHLHGLLDVSQIELLKKEQFKNRDIEKLIGKTSFKQLTNYLDSQKLITYSYKQQLQNKLSYILDNSSSKSQYKELCEKNDIYIRELNTKGRISYGMQNEKGKMFYVEDSKLSMKFRHSNINAIGKEKVFSRKEQRQYIKQMSIKTLSKARTIDEFIGGMKLKGINVKLEKHQSGKVFGLSFSQDIDNSHSFKGSEIDRYKTSWNKIEGHFNALANEQSTGKLDVQKANDPLISDPKTKAPKLPGKTNTPDHEDEWERRQRLKHGGTDLDQQL